MPKYSQGDIVIIKTFDAFRGDVVIPAVVRYYDEEHDAYEVNAYLDDGSSCSDMENVHWWTVTEREIQQLVCKASIERPIVKQKGKQTFEVHRF